ncbi:hypothetical protein [Sandaracinus amylolyticus]|uniref:hypothetical protein n=1 Tax=Sandaracinus amylolyticus TaxID=927083 RepID=UPI001F339024|nr:hypothetical protein [Sandaracinus amylolyticus]UJR79858.1 Hypothetical protein I5071_18970 [Sandaracinus amylolyticus]
MTTGDEMTDHDHDPETLRNHTEDLAQKLSDAIDGMAVSPLPLRERIRDAADTFWPMIGEALPTELAAALNSIRDRLTVATGPQGSIAASAAQLSDDDAEELAHDFCKLRDDAIEALADMDEAAEELLDAVNGRP